MLKANKLIGSLVLLFYCGVLTNNEAAAASEPGISPVVRADARKMVFLVNRADATKIAFLTAAGADDSFCKSYQAQNPRLAYCGPADKFNFDEAQKTFDVIFTEKIATGSAEAGGSTTKITVTPLLIAASLAASALGMRSVGQGLAAGVSSNPNSPWTTTTATSPTKDQPAEGKYFLLYEVFEKFTGNIKNFSRFRCKDGVDMAACRESWKALLLVQPKPAVQPQPATQPQPAKSLGGN